MGSTLSGGWSRTDSMYGDMTTQWKSKEKTKAKKCSKKILVP
jgi:hypothetical protein